MRGRSILPVQRRLKGPVGPARPILVALLLIAAAPQAAPLSPEAFRDRFAAAVQAATRHPTTTVDARTFRATKADGSAVTINIDNAYTQYLTDPAQMDAVVARFTRVLTEADDATALVDQLVVIVRPTDYVARSLPVGGDLSAMPAPRPMAGDLSLFLAVDAPETIRMANARDLARWHLDEAAAWTRATANLATRVGPLTAGQPFGPHGPTTYGAASGLAPSALADPARCGPAAPNGRGGEVVIVFTRSGFSAADPADPAQLTAFWAAVGRGVAAHEMLSDTPITCRGGHWTAATAP